MERRVKITAMERKRINKILSMDGKLKESPLKMGRGKREKGKREGG